MNGGKITRFRIKKRFAASITRTQLKKKAHVTLKNTYTSTVAVVYYYVEPVEAPKRHELMHCNFSSLMISIFRMV